MILGINSPRSNNHRPSRGRMPKFLLPNKKILWGRVSMLQRNREELPPQMAKTMHHHAPLPKNFKFRRPRLFLRIK